MVSDYGVEIEFRISVALQDTPSPRRSHFDRRMPSFYQVETGMVIELWGYIVVVYYFLQEFSAVGWAGATDENPAVVGIIVILPLFVLPRRKPVCKVVSLYCSPECPSCLGPLNIIGWATCTIKAASKRYSLRIPLPGVVIRTKDWTVYVHAAADVLYFPSLHDLVGVLSSCSSSCSSISCMHSGTHQSRPCLSIFIVLCHQTDSMSTLMKRIFGKFSECDTRKLVIVSCHKYFSLNTAWASN